MPVCSVGENVKKPIVRVKHAELARVTPESPYRSWCPMCESGVLLVCRFSLEDPRLSALDHCSFCGQHVWYTDETIGGEQVHAPVPTTLEGCFPLLEGGLSDEDRETLKNARDPNDVAVSWHDSIGRQMRNRWGLWHGSPLAVHMKERFGLEHPDDMSHKILVEFATAHIPTVWQRLVREE